MKYIEMFEEYDELKEKFYWLVPTGYRFEDSLKKINCPDKKIKNFLSNEIISKEPYAFIGYNKYRGNTEEGKWGWQDYKGDTTEDYYYEENNYHFMGTVNIDESEFNANKYNI